MTSAAATQLTESRIHVRGVLFDFDGLLADTASAWRAAEESVAAASGRPWTDDDHRSLHGLGIDSAAKALACRLGRCPSESESIRGEMLSAYSREAHRVAPMPGATRVVEALRTEYPLAVASNSPAQLVEQQIEQLGLRRHFRAIVCADASIRSKPAPDVYQHAARRLGCHPRHTVALDDSQAGVHAARDAGCTTIGVSRTVELGDCWHADTLYEALAVFNWLQNRRLRGRPGARPSANTSLEQAC